MGFVGEGAGVGVRPPRGGELSRFIGSTAWWWTRMFNAVIPGMVACSCSVGIEKNGAEECVCACQCQRQTARRFLLLLEATSE